MNEMTIAEVSEKYDITADTLRYYERIGLLPHIRKNAGGFRDYSEQDCSWVNFIKCMRGAGVSVEALAEYVSLFQQGDSTLSARKQLLTEQRDKLAERVSEMQEVLERLNRKIEGYEDIMVKCEKDLKVWD